MRRVRTGGVVLALACGLGAGAGDSPPVVRSVPVKPGVGGPASGAALADLGPAPEVRLTDQNGRPFALADLRGKAVVVSFVYTTCTGVCPATTAALSQVRSALKREGLWGTRVAFVSVSLDPRRDTPEALSAYARTYGVGPGDPWHFLTGPPDEVDRVVRAWGMWAKMSPAGVLDHPSRLFLLDPNGRRREIYNLEFFPTAAVVNDVRAVLGAGAP